MDIYATITDRMIQEMEQGIIPWRKPWMASGAAISHTTGKPYSLLNQMLLGKAGEWLTFKQVQAEGGYVRKGEKSRICVFWKWIDKEDEETGEVTIPYSGRVEELLPANKGKTGILYVTEISRMKDCIEYANSIGYRANGFWSVSDKAQRDHPMTADQFQLRETVLCDETIPDYVDLLVINRASETCIKIQAQKRKVDFMIVHDKNEEIRTQVRGRYHGDLDTFFYHSVEDANRFKIKEKRVPAKFLNRPLYTEDMEGLRWEMNLLRPDGKHYGNPTLIKYLKECGYCVSDPVKDRKRNGKYYRIITE